MIPVIASIMLLPKMLFVAMQMMNPPASAAVLYSVLMIGFVAGTAAIAFFIMNLPAFGDRRVGELGYLLRGLAPLTLSAFLVSAYWFLSSGFDVPQDRLITNNFAAFCWFGILMHVIGTVVGLVYSRRIGINAILVAALSGFLDGALTYAVLQGIRQLPTPYHRQDLFLVISVPIVLGIYGTIGMLLVGLTSKMTEDEDREWWARSGAFMFLVMLAWPVMTFLMVFAVPLLDQLGKTVVEKLRAQAAVGGIGAVISYIVSHIGASVKTFSGRENKPGTAAAGGKAQSLALPAFGLLGLALIAVFICSANEKLIAALADPRFSNSDPRVLWIYLGALIGEALFIWAAAAFVNANKFSLHAMYRNRLVRAYLGAARDRNPNPFTGFDPKDNTPMSEVNREKDNAGRIERPLHVVNMSLNLVRGQNLAWQERKAESFTVTALHAGSCRVRYQRTAKYGGLTNGISLGTAVEISGAAASPNMGYHSSPVLSAIMTFFNVRLGWWLANPGQPGRRFWRNNAPRYALRPLLDEALGNTTDENKWIYLSDGGHFENLGLYEMVLRRCRTIIVVDAGADPHYTFEDLGNAVRKIRIDLGVSIEFSDPLPTKQGGHHCCLGTVNYRRIDGDSATNGTLIYIKPVVCDRVQTDVAQYASTDSTFPHQSTLDQFFSESQFESYRRLGLHSVEHIVGELS